MKRLFVLLIASVVTLMSFAGISFAGEAEKEDDRDFMNYLFELSDDMSDEDYCWTVEKNFRIIKNFQLLFTEDSYKAFNKAHKVNNRENAEKCNAALELLVPVRSVADAVWFLWDKDNMPMADEDLQPGQVDAESELDYDGFIPFVIKFLQEDQSQVKGNILMCSGGGFHYRSNAGEAYKVMPIFYEMGYNVFILQRRIAPFCAEDIFMDMQRAIRMIRYYGEKENYGGLDMVATMGWSGGGGTIMGTLQTAYGDISPADLSLTEYVPDEIDAVSSDMDVANVIYGVGNEEIPPFTPISSILVNPNLPAFYICHGTDDEIVPVENARALYSLCQENNIPAQYFEVPGAVHGFGPGGGEKGGEGSENWPAQADAFMQAIRNGEEAMSTPDDYKDYLLEVRDDMSDEEYCKTVEKNYRMVKNIQLLFTPESFKEFNQYHRVKSREKAEKCNEAFDLLVQERSVADAVWFLWDADNMPSKDGKRPTPEEIDEKSHLDYAEFIPFVIKFLLDDPSSAKGNIILCSGGGFSDRSNGAEAYKTYPIFNDLGYNVFILQRRIEPYPKEDSYMDMQRAVRFVRYYAEQEGWGGQDMIAGVGWSGGTGTLLGAVKSCYGYLTPADEYASDYIPDELDSVRSDMDVVMPIYGVGPTPSENPHAPAFFIASGSEDTTVPPDITLNMFNNLQGAGIPAVRYVFEGAQHGFGPGGGDKGGVGSEEWPYMADEYMQSYLGHSSEGNE